MPGGGLQGFDRKIRQLLPQLVQTRRLILCQPKLDHRETPERRQQRVALQAAIQTGFTQIEQNDVEWETTNRGFLMSAIPTHDNAPAFTGWYAVSVDNTEGNSAGIRLTEHMTLGVDDLGKQVLTSSAASHACHIRSDRGMLRIEPVRGDVRVDGRVIGARVLLSRSSVLRLGQHAFFISDSLLVEEPMEVVSELPGYWQPFMEELEAIPEPQPQIVVPEAIAGQTRQRSRGEAPSVHKPEDTNGRAALSTRLNLERPSRRGRRRLPPRRVRRTWLPVAIAGIVTVSVVTATAIVADPSGTPAKLWGSLLGLFS